MLRQPRRQPLRIPVPQAPAELGAVDQEAQHKLVRGGSSGAGLQVDAPQVVPRSGVDNDIIGRCRPRSARFLFGYQSMRRASALSYAATVVPSRAAWDWRTPYGKIGRMAELNDGEGALAYGD